MPKKKLNRIEMDETMKVLTGEDYVRPPRYQVSSWSEGLVNIFVLFGALVLIGLLAIILLVH